MSLGGEECAFETTDAMLNSRSFDLTLRSVSSRSGSSCGKCFMKELMRRRQVRKISCSRSRLRVVVTHSFRHPLLNLCNPCAVAGMSR